MSRPCRFLSTLNSHLTFETVYMVQVMDKCAIYILIAGSYTPFLQVVLAHEPLFSNYLLFFLWTMCILGIGVEFVLPNWMYKPTFSLAMYLGMGWSALVCLPEVARTMPNEGVRLMLLGGVAYTAGVPFFVRNNSKYSFEFIIGLFPHTRFSQQVVP